MYARLNLDYLENLFSQIRGLGLEIQPHLISSTEYKKVICSRSLLTPGTTSVRADRADEDVIMLSEKILSQML
jgi:hypothetical protein